MGARDSIDKSILMTAHHCLLKVRAQKGWQRFLQFCKGVSSITDREHKKIIMRLCYGQVSDICVEEID